MQEQGALCLLLEESFATQRLRRSLAFPKTGKALNSFVAGDYSLLSTRELAQSPREDL